MTVEPVTEVRPETFRNCVFLSGPTASGKTAVGIALAEILGGEIVSLDSMALYRRMDIGTAKPTPDERARVPHHLVDVVEPGEEYSVARYLDDAASAVRAIEARGKRALFVGGTPLYLKALLRGLFAGPEADWALRERLLDEARRLGGAALHDRLREVDPAAAAKLHPNDVRRVIRALEVFEQTGRPLSEMQTQFSTTTSGRTVFVLDWPREQLHERINRRVDAMFAAGFVDEVRALVAAGPLSHTAAQAVGYPETIAYLEAGGDPAATIEQVKLRTRQFAKRQMTWFRSLPECRFWPLAEPFDPMAVARAIATAIGRS